MAEPSTKRQAVKRREQRLERALAAGREPGRSGRPAKACPHCGEKAPKDRGWCTECGRRVARKHKDPLADLHAEIKQAKIASLDTEAARPQYVEIGTGQGGDSGQGQICDGNGFYATNGGSLQNLLDGGPRNT